MKADEQVAGLTRLLGALIRVSGQTRQTLERRLGWSAGYLSRLLAGSIDLKMRHVLLICEALGVEPGEFFHMAYPGRPTAGWQDRPLWCDRPTAAPSPPISPISDDELDRRIRASLAKILGEMKEADELAEER